MFSRYGRAFIGLSHVEASRQLLLLAQNILQPKALLEKDLLINHTTTIIKGDKRKSYHSN